MNCKITNFVIVLFLLCSNFIQTYCMHEPKQEKTPHPSIPNKYCIIEVAFILDTVENGEFTYTLPVRKDNVKIDNKRPDLVSFKFSREQLEGLIEVYKSFNETSS
jgi:hypothetical protein